MNKQLMRNAGFGDHIDSVEKGLCPFCKKEIDFNGFKDELSRKEFKISGICQQCQDDTFG